MEYNGYIISSHGKNPSSLYIATVGKGGKIPNVLDGLFTSYGIAKEAIDNYLLIKDSKNAQKNDKSGD